MASGAVPFVLRFILNLGVGEEGRLLDIHSDEALSSLGVTSLRPGPLLDFFSGIVVCSDDSAEEGDSLIPPMEGLGES